jgi:cytoskeletal protein CcmA (bactofilin family)
MFGREEENMSQKTTSGGGSASILGAGSQFEGKVTTQGTLRVEGELIGEAECRDTLEVGKTGIVRANLNVKEAVIAGKVFGNIRASSRIELQSGSHLEGDIVTKRLVIDEGVFFEGNCKMGEKMPDGPSSKRESVTMEKPQGSPTLG